jgi:hypothetical protein
MVEPFGNSMVQLTFPGGESIAVWDAAIAVKELRRIK